MNIISSNTKKGESIDNMKEEKKLISVNELSDEEREERREIITFFLLLIIIIIIHFLYFLLLFRLHHYHNLIHLFNAPCFQIYDQYCFYNNNKFF